ncbi:hypothetical protein G1H11_21100 [Phytoactinopolyspora alkaliphila]|uniref:Tetracycline repressor TetR C-terminal domain-containing protein n=1 Tax=Phytoactinopolyspora alkaliphila TaxID=1783498 RepID=A0A6N9YRY4_9ACTN|nr:hypothetical protein [Phytoactinopolyspora alkaliphila]
MRSELVYSLLERAGLEGSRLTAAVGALTYYVQGYTATENVWRTSQRDPAAEAGMRRQAQEYLDRQSGQCPTLTRHAELENDDFDGAFQLGLDLILDGIEARIGA